MTTKDLGINLKKRNEFFKKSSPVIAKKMSKAIERLVTDKINVKFGNIQTFEQNRLLINVGEKCFGSHVNFKGAMDARGIVVVVFPVDSAKTLVELLLKRYLDKLDKETIDKDMKLSAFKEASNILALTYITELSNILKNRVETSVPKFVSFSNIEFIKPSILKRHSNLDNLVSVSQFSLDSSNKECRGRGTVGNPYPLLKGALFLFLNQSFFNKLSLIKS